MVALIYSVMFVVVALFDFIDVEGRNVCFNYNTRGMVTTADFSPSAIDSCAGAGYRCCKMRFCKA